MKGFRTAMTVIGAAVALGIVGTAVAPVAAIAAPAARAAFVDVHVPSDGGGVAGRKVKAVSDGTWRVRHVDTDAQHFASTSHTVYLDVRGGTAPCAAE